MKILQSTIEQMAWYIVALVMVAATATGVGAYIQGRNLSRQNQRIEKLALQVQESIKEGQANRNFQTQATQGYIKCIATLSKTHPELTKESSLKDINLALDDCATQTTTN